MAIEQPKKVAVEEPEIVESEVVIPPFPRLPGALGRLVEAVAPDIPYEFKALYLLTAVGLELSGRIKLVSEPWLQTRFYACNVGHPQGGKSAAGNMIDKVLKQHVAYSTELSIDSGPGLVEALCETENHRLLLSPDELADQFDKAKVSGNSMFGEWLKLYEHNKTANRIRKKGKKDGGGGGLTQVTDAHFAIAGGTQIDRVASMWQGSSGSANGMASRFVYAYSEAVLPRWQAPDDDLLIDDAIGDIKAIFKAVELTELMGETPKVWRLPVLPEAQEVVMNWRPFDDGDPNMRRLIDHAKRFAMIAAVFMERDNIDAEAMQLGVDFAEYQLALRQRLSVPDAANAVQAFEHRILTFFSKNVEATFHQLKQGIKPDRHPGGFEAFNRAFRALLNGQAIFDSGKRTRKKQPIFSVLAEPNQDKVSCP